MYKTVTSRPINYEGLKKFSNWVEYHNWIEMYKCEEIDEKVQIFQDTLVKKYGMFSCDYFENFL